MTEADLHTHTTFSDGTTTPAVNAALARAAGLAALAITDHDTVDHYEAAEAACRGEGLQWVPGLELSTEEGRASVHLLGYWVDAGDGPLRAELLRLRGERARRATAMVARLATHGVAVDRARVEAIAAGAPIGRPHVAAAMVEAGLVPDLQAAFDEWLADGRPGAEPKQALAPEAGVALIRGAGGAAVLAHPGFSGPDGEGGPGLSLALLDRLAAAGLAGVEADHPGHEPEVAASWRDAAIARGLVVTGASDYHGERKSLKIGQLRTPLAQLDALRDRADRRTSPW